MKEEVKEEMEGLAGLVEEDMVGDELKVCTNFRSAVLECKIAVAIGSVGLSICLPFRSLVRS